jgi:hypothetical protein
MEKYRKLKVIGKGSFGYAVLVQSVVDRQTYVMKVQWSLINFYRSLMFPKWIKNSERTPSTRYAR